MVTLFCVKESATQEYLVHVLAVRSIICLHFKCFARLTFTLIFG